MWETINTLGWVGLILGGVCIMALLYQRDVNREREKQEAAKKNKADEKNAA
jgi:hypothetical protein